VRDVSGIEIKSYSFSCFEKLYIGYQKRDPRRRIFTRMNSSIKIDLELTLVLRNKIVLGDEKKVSAT
jgi:hypothetical protein